MGITGTNRTNEARGSNQRGVNQRDVNQCGGNQRGGNQRGISRRGFLVAAGLGATAAALTACTGGTTGATGTASATPATTGASTAPTGSSTAAAGPINYPELAGQLAGRLLTPDSSGYAAARLSYNPLFDSRRPAAVAQVATAADVQRCVAAAAASTTPIAARSGGHSYVGASTPDNALVVDVSALNKVTVNPDGTATVGTGTRLIDLYAALAAAGRCLPGGSCPSVGVAGLTLGGGIGVLARKYGLTCDRLTGVDIVTADGTARTATANADADLFWALRGGGGGNFGIATSFTFSTEPAPALTVFSLRYPAGSVGDVLAGWQQWIAGAPDELWSNCNISSGSAPSCVVGGCYVGSPSALAPLLDQLVSAVGRAPSSRFSSAKSYLAAMQYFAGCSADSVAECHLDSAGGVLGRNMFVASSRVISKPVTDTAAFVAACTGAPGLAVIVDGLGGAVGQPAADATAFPHRGAVATVQLYHGTTAAGQTAATSQVAAARDALTSVLGSGAYVNYLDSTTPVADYYQGNLLRLRQVAAQYDPHAVFSTLASA